MKSLHRRGNGVAYGRWLACCALLAGVASAPARAEAEPSLWQRAAAPRTVRVERALNRIERVLDHVNQAEDDADMMQDFRLGALAVAELTGAREFGDPRLWVLLSQALIGAELGREDEAVALLERALSATEPEQRWLEAEIRPLLAAALRRDPERALREVTRALPLVWEPSVRSILFRERAEAKMALGQVRGSAQDARSALAAANTPVQRALSRFGLALALERAGDLPSALTEIHLARLSAPALGGSELAILDLPGVFVFRPEDAEYVSALDAMAQARSARSAREARLSYERALVAWEHYQALVSADDRWLAVARVHAGECERERARLLRQEPPPRPPPDSSGSFF